MCEVTTGTEQTGRETCEDTKRNILNESIKYLVCKTSESVGKLPVNTS